MPTNDEERLWHKKPKNKWYCSKTKGLHQFKLIFPTSAKYYMEGPRKEWFKGVTTPEEYYAAHEKMDDFYDKEYFKVYGVHRFWWHMYFWQCIHCGKLAYDSKKHPNKRIRNNLIP